MKKVRITVLKKLFFEDVVKEYGAEGLTPCPVFQEGQVFESTGFKPAGFCDDAWNCIQKYVFALCAGADNFFDGTWLKKDTVQIGSCCDGLRPVLFRIETVED